jgi:chromosomal replication initiator protein
MDIELAKEVLKDSISPNANNEITSQLIIQIVAEHFNIAATDLTSKKKSQNIVIPRQIVMYLCRELTEDSFSAIGQLLGGKDHSTVMHGYEKVLTLIETNDQIKNAVEVLKKKLLPN